MESRPQNPEFRNNPESFTHVLYETRAIRFLRRQLGFLFYAAFEENYVTILSASV